MTSHSTHASSRPILVLALLVSGAADAIAQVAPSLADPLGSRAPAAQFSDPDRVSRLAAAYPAIDTLVRAFVERAAVPGAAWGIIVDGRLVHVGTTGLRDVARGTPVDTASVFRIASMTKSFTAAAILQLRDAGRLRLDDPVTRHVPELADLRRPTMDAPEPTIRDLLTHAAGFPEDNPWGDQQLSATEAALSAMMRGGIPFSNVPGVAYEYSNLGFAILGRVVANVSGMPFAEYLATRLLQPLGMTSTTLEATTVPASRLAHGYRRQDGRWLEEPPLPDGSFGPMGGMLTSIADLSRWVGFLLDAWPARDGGDEGPLRRASRREMQQVLRFAGATVARDTATGTVALNAGGYGYGLRVAQTCLFRLSVSHTGGLPGFGSLMRWLPESGVGIVALGNLTYTGWTPIAEQALVLLARTGGLAPRAPQPAPVLLTRQRQVSALVSQWSNALADSLAAMNLYRDESRDRRRSAIERIVAQAGGDCRPAGRIVAENALRGRWRMRCRDGDLRVTITLAPTEPALVQYLDVAPMRPDDQLTPAPTCR